MSRSEKLLLSLMTALSGASIACAAVERYPLSALTAVCAAVIAGFLFSPRPRR